MFKLGTVGDNQKDPVVLVPAAVSMEWVGKGKSGQRFITPWFFMFFFAILFMG